MYRILAVLIGYVFGNFLFGFLYGKMHHKDIRTLGSGNVGTTNTVRTMGVLPGVITLFCDCIKVVVAYFVCGLIFSKTTNLGESYIQLLQVYAAFGAVLGHDFPAVLKFKGGKGIASSLGFICVVLPEALPGALVCFVLVVCVTRFVSLGSILAAIVIFAESLIFYHFDLFHYEGLFNIEVLLIIIFLVYLTIFLHRSNIKRLASGNENKFSFHPNV